MGAGSRGPARNWVWTALGTFFVGLGIMGIVLPLLPTTPFLLLAAGCYAKGSSKAYRWLIGNRYFGPYIKNYQEGRGMSRRGKTVSLCSLYLVLGLSAYLLRTDLLLVVVLIVVAAAVSTHILTIRTMKAAD